MRTIRRLCSGLILAGGAVWMGGAVAAPAPTESSRQEIVSVKDLDLGTASGVATLYERLRAASLHVCKPWTGDSAGSKATWDLCRDATLAHMVNELKLTVLTAYYDARLQGNAKPTVASTARR